MQQSEYRARIEQLRAHLRDQGYGSVARRNYARIARRFLEYLYDHARTVETALPADVEDFLRRERRVYRKRHGRAPPSIPKWRRSCTAPLRLILHLVQGQWPPTPAPKQETLRELFHRKLLKGYDIWMDELRGLARATRVQRIDRAREFLSRLGERSEPNLLHELQVRDIDAYLTCRTQGLRRKSINDVTSDLRVFLRYLHGSGTTARDLSTSVTSPILYTYEDIPSAPLAEDVQKVLATTRRDRNLGGRRDYAILTLLATYGLRSGEITALRLDDLDWRNEVLLVRHSKTGTSSKLPLLPEPGEALLNYLENARPRSAVREVFLCLNAPHRAFPHGSALYDVIRRRLDAAGIVRHGKKGPHAFRHARAVSLLRAAVPLKQIGDILGHRSTLSTGVYLKLATEDLRGVALEVPAAVSP
jgi:integrase/recombinase XerD